jgi:meso-butanediol dehydrogenase/(S,S)-butanediol dehydrogenase/diacetyl reductase
MTKRLAGKVAVITAATKGIGRATVEKMVSEGAKVVFCGRDTVAGAAVEAAVNGSERAAIFIEADCMVLAQMDKLFDTAVAEFGGVDILFNSVGGGSFGETPDMELSEWNEMFQIDVTTTFYCCKLGIPLMKKRGGGAIVNNASMSGMFGEAGLGAYCAAKAAVINYTRVLALDHGKDRIRANAVCPGFIATGPSADLAKDATLRAKILDRMPVGRLGEPADIANAVVFLASDEASFITGQTLVADGGMTAGTNLPQLLG